MRKPTCRHHGTSSSILKITCGSKSVETSTWSMREPFSEALSSLSCPHPPKWTSRGFKLLRLGSPSPKPFGSLKRVEPYRLRTSKRHAILRSPSYPLSEFQQIYSSICCTSIQTCLIHFNDNQQMNMKTDYFYTSLIGPPGIELSPGCLGPTPDK